MTKKAGEEIARIAGADFFEIVPKEIYTDADIGEGLSVHYSGGANLSEDIQDWLEINGIKN